MSDTKIGVPTAKPREKAVTSWPAWAMLMPASREMIGRMPMMANSAKPVKKVPSVSIYKIVRFILTTSYNCRGAARPL
ncbi:hypothetical protein OMP38_31210 [Cohnella ginsengisoli]|uniref:Uncharacterized protein n=1 Tax=Cohnella ginsengisoli TaxID=425004 RepID=A0A9X4KMT9_9BACL|nr:hypothetical protein [Cohnella ginsengisoli]MDG0794800.1 hypothetical protein [Cohnella ginsengisoli]